MARKKENSRAKTPESETPNGDGFFNGFELKGHLLSLVDSFLEYIETLLLYLRKSAEEKVKRGVQAYVFLRIGFYFLGLASLLFIGAFFLFLLKTFGGDPIPAALGTGGLCLFFSLFSLALVASKLKG
ncbi:hypothetical protein LEP1GSC058_1089 [Leptospira fainei serovar Hurstbridge str. BUT 6]|uniref:Uncharacterized protein n=1 Tax=Leptospira fainei serovar Hurstbridge str. BUT 6 TaxID=1193011 RepID=S3V8J0_9LEPT|nr:hypothetical protein [Leptospira fainei]EPG72740.1 hypothetical protein LEP1GSC058_1089 [Leptospira fainei serovar Hurstbridge str. BUT 6]